MNTKGIITKSIVRKAIAFAGFCSLSIFLASANLASPDGGLQGGASTIAPTSEKTILDQGERKPFGENSAPGSPLRAAPGGGGGTGQKQDTAPVGEGIWALIGLAVVYGVVRRNSKKV